jgi:hypothetical protein
MLKNWEAGLGVVGDEFLDWETLLGTLEDALRANKLTMSLEKITLRLKIL